MEYKCTNSLSKETGYERRNRSSCTTTSTDCPDSTERLTSAHTTKEDRRSAWVDRAKEETDNRDSDGVAYNVWHKPNKKFKSQCADGEEINEFLLAYSLSRGR
ncbi:hypothetical protein FGSG_13618 [Fusarium graminearum PH-1]|uniref:hypothetical protein n=1 Tax=Gibberella zeae (strain ATCC MYA-4620 / CBS 123657 / FGSC 9075 / NRRL 31084 / PH-1) TaxID=229533 RepID=UPI00021F1A39|nr:hypothetical protein FGSG_13618 [Fusarium graminearum PH-1]ESU16265.1 hypothetical protein FGSG_13618 [Fusarium graminearum PH-1]|eukprot:XP_011328051.1 hypothetical protein FGSG_13618 [Fusarium graminearum PH-1]